MQVLHSQDALRAALRHLPAPTLVPTMGNLHAGHLALVAHARTFGAPVVVSIFVNRLQFGPHEDFDRYPRTLQRDCELLRSAGCDIVFAPDEATMYPQPQTFQITPDPLVAGVLDGAARPGHFAGVCTVVMKLFQMVAPHQAVFGKKDYQQLLLIRAMASQFALPVGIVGLETVRADDGLALSSRNGYLDAAQRDQAPQLNAALRELARAARTGSDPALLPMLETQVHEELAALGWSPDYLTVRRRVDLQPPSAADLAREDTLVALGAARLGNTRLIDNVEC